jgi:hypothetical protein
MTTPPNRADFLLEEDDWEPPPRTFRVRPLASAIALLVVAVAFVSIRAMWTGEKARAAQDLEAQRPVESPWSPIPSAPLHTDSSWLPAPATSNARAGSPRVRAPSPSLSTSPAKPPPSPPKGRGDQAVTTLPGYLSINSTPWAELSVDGRVIGNTPQLNIRVTAGAHEVALRRNGFETRRTSVTVGSGSTVRITNIVLTRVAP